MLLVGVGIIFWSSCSILSPRKQLPSYYSSTLKAGTSDEPMQVSEELKVVRLMDKSNPMMPRLKETITFKLGNEIHGNKQLLRLANANETAYSFVNYKMLSFFPRSTFQIEADMLQSAKLVFKPLVDSIFLLQRRTNQNALVAKVIIAGYSDGVAIREGSAIYAQLKQIMRGLPLSSQSMNSFLSYLRALAVSDVIHALLVERTSELKSFDKVYIELLSEGRGEASPDASKKFRIEDERRRIVKLYWYVSDGA